LSLHRSTSNSPSTQLFKLTACYCSLLHLTASHKIKSSTLQLLNCLERRFATDCKVNVEFTSRLAVYPQSVHLGVKPLETHNQRFLFQLTDCKRPWLSPICPHGPRTENRAPILLLTLPHRKHSFLHCCLKRVLKGVNWAVY
jgi:hypothetical protein